MGSKAHCADCRLIEEKQHRFAELLAAHGDREKAYRGASYTAKAWSTHVSRLLSKERIWRSFLHHRNGFSEKTTGSGVELRELEWASSNANVFDLFTSQDPDSGALKHLRTLCASGIEVIGDDGQKTSRLATDEEILVAAGAALTMRPKLKHEMTHEEQMQAETLTVDNSRGGKIIVGTGRAAARGRYAKLTEPPERVIIEHEVKLGLGWIREGLIREIAAVMVLAKTVQAALGAGAGSGSGSGDAQETWLLPAAPQDTQEVEIIDPAASEELSDLIESLRGVPARVLRGDGG